jgi:hypothetical protein
VRTAEKDWADAKNHNRAVQDALGAAASGVGLEAAIRAVWEEAWNAGHQAGEAKLRRSSFASMRLWRESLY